MSRPPVAKPCPHPEKAAYPSRRRASVALDRVREVAADQVVGWRIYHCQCDAWHFTSQPYRYWEHPTRPEHKARHLAPVPPAQPWESASGSVSSTLRTAKPKCLACRRPWLSDLDPEGRRCPKCGGEISSRKAERWAA